MNRYPTTLPAEQQGVVLLEALIGLVIFSLGLLALTGLQATMLKNTDNAKYRTEAAFIAQDKISEIWLAADPVPVNHAGTEAVSLLPGGKIAVAIESDGTYEITVNWTPPGGVEHTYVTNARIEGF